MVLFFSLGSLVVADIFGLLQEMDRKLYSSKSYLLYKDIMNSRDLFAALILILFKRNEDMISCFSKIDDVKISAVFQSDNRFTNNNN